MSRLNKIFKKKKFTTEVPLEPAACWLTLEAILEVTRPGVESFWKDFISSKKIAWKTGTSYGFRDAWAIGVSPNYAVGVWVGNADGEVRPGLTGIAVAASILFDIFDMLPVKEWFLCPEGDLRAIQVCEKSGYRAVSNCLTKKSIDVPNTNLQIKSCPYCKIVHCDKEILWQVHSECESVVNMKTLNWFVLPPTIEWYYKRRHSDYKTLPPFRKDCLSLMGVVENKSFNLIYPENNGEIFIPVDLDGRRSEVVLKAAHRISRTTIYWHLDDNYVGATNEIDEIALDPQPGQHAVTLVDENGESLKRVFKILTKE